MIPRIDVVTYKYVIHDLLTLVSYYIYGRTVTVSLRYLLKYLKYYTLFCFVTQALFYTFFINIKYYLYFHSERISPVRVQTVPAAARGVIFSWRTIMEVTTVITGTI